MFDKLSFRIHEKTSNLTPQSEQVCVESPPSALNVTLPAFAAERRRLQHGALPTGRSAANPPAAVAAADVILY